MFARINNAIIAHVARHESREEGQTMAEYGLVLALVAVLCITAFTLMKNAIVATLTTITGSL